MEFRIADTFTESLARLTGDEQKAAKTTAFDLQINPASPGMSFHKLAKSRDKGFWSVRVSQDVRIIVHRTAQSLLLCYVDHHDKAYGWAERRKLETHPTTGAAQLVEVRERVEEILVPTYVPQSAATTSKQPLFAKAPEAELLAYGVPPEWLADVRGATEDTLLSLADHLPAEAAEALLELATGGAPRKLQPVAAPADPFEHPDARRRFRVVTDVDELARALEYPWERWIVFLYPAQRELVERRFGGPARIAGSAGTGKTVVALHRAAHLARADPDARVLLTTFSAALASSLRIKLARLIGTEPRLRERIDVEPLDTVARRLHDRMLGRAEIASRDVVRQLVNEAARDSVDPNLSPGFLLSEWTEVVDAWQLDSWDAYRDVARLGRKTRLPEKQRQALWAIFERVRTSLREKKLLTQAELYGRLTAHLAGGERRPYDHVVVDEAQDVSVAQLRFVASLGKGRPAPVLRVVDSAAEESAVVGRWLAERAAEGVAPGEMAVFVRSATELSRARAAVEAAGLLVSLLDDDVKTVRDRVPAGTMHLSKGLEFRAVAVMACDDEVLPLQARIEAVADEGDLAEVYDTERHLLYVACTRARDHLLVTGVSPVSEFLHDFGG